MSRQHSIARLTLCVSESLSPVETGSYLGHCLGVPRHSLPDELIEYVYRVSAGIPKYISLTAGQLLQGAIVIGTEGWGVKSLRHRESLLREEVEDRVDREATDREEGVTSPRVAVDDRDDETQYVQGLTGKLDIPVDARSSDDDSERGSDAEYEKLHGGRCKHITVHKFKQKMQLGIPLPAPPDIPAVKKNRLSATTRPAQTGKLQPKLVVDELSLSEIIKVDPEKELELVEGLYVRKSRHGGNGRKWGDGESDAHGTEPDSVHRFAFKKGFQQRTDDILRYGRAKYETPVRDAFATQPGVDDTTTEPDWETGPRGFRDRTHPLVGRPFLPPGPELFTTSRVGQLAFVPEFEPAYETSVECQTLGNKTERQASKEHAFGPLTTIKAKLGIESDNVRVRVIKDLKTVPFVPELVS